MRDRLTRRSAIQYVLGLSGTALLAACAPAATPAPPTSAPAAPAAPTTAAAKPAAAATVAATPAAAAKPSTDIKRGGVLRTGMVGDIVTLDGILWQPNSSATVGMAYDVLLTYDEEHKPRPRLAESWELSDDLRQIKLNLRPGVQFHSGREFTSDDVRYNLLRARDPKNTFASTVATGSAWWTGIETPDKSTIILTSEKPRPGVFDFLLYLRILDKDTMDGPEASTKVNGTGPYRFVEWVSGDHITLERNSQYWESGIPNLDGAHITIMRDQQTMVSALEAGSIDVAFLAPIVDAARLQSDSRYTVTNQHDVGQYFYATANATVPPTDNKQLRQAISFAIDRKRFAETVLKGFGGQPQALPWTPRSPAWDESKNNVYTYDLDRAKSLVDASGLTNIEFDITYATAGFSAEYAALATILQADLAKIGIKTNLKPVDNAVFTASGAGMTPTYNGLRLSAAAFAHLSEATTHFALSRTYGHLSNQAGFYDDTYKALVEQAGTEPDPAKRKMLYGQINDFILDASYTMAICPYPNMLIMRSNVRGLGYAPPLEWTLRSAWLA